MTAARGTSNSNRRGSVTDRARRRAALVARDGWPECGIVLCARCDVPLLQDEDPDAPGQSLTVDRITPGCQGGTYALDNVRAFCGPCNQETGGHLGASRKAASSGQLDSVRYP